MDNLNGGLDKVTLPGFDGQGVVMDVLYDHSDDTTSCRVTATTNRLKAYMEYSVTTAENIPEISDLEQILDDCSISFGVDPEGLELIVKLLRWGDASVGPVQVAQGDMPRKGKDGFVDFSVKPISDEADYSTDTAGKMDFKQTHRLESAYAGREIAKMRPPENGSKGRTVHGDELGSTDGQRIKVKVGHNVRFDRKENKFFAEIDGCVIYKDNTVSVSPVYTVEGDLDLSIGNLDFVGELVINGSVHESFSIRAKQGITVNGAVAACTMWSEGNIVIRGGVHGKGKGVIKSEKGSVNAKYLDEVRVESLHGITVLKEIINSRLFTSGAVRVAAGSIIGGAVNALKGVEAAVLGSDLGVQTRISTGLDWISEGRIDECIRRKAELDDFIKELEENVKPVTSNAVRLKSYKKERKQTIKEALEKLKELLAERDRLDTEIETLREEKREESVFQINIMKSVYSGVIVRMGAMLELFQEQLSGPLTIVPDEEVSRLAFRDYEKLPFSE